MKRILSLFDHSGNWPSYFQERNDVRHLDIKHGIDILEMGDAGDLLDMYEDVDGIIAAPPCTDFTISGAQYWPQKDANGTTAQSLELVYQVLRLANLFEPTDPDWYEDEDHDGTFFWVFENPVGRLPKLIPGIGKAYYFDPCDFAGHTGISNSDHNELDRIRRKDGMNITQEDVEFVLEKNAYTKKTGLWGNFNRNLEKKRVEPVRLCKQGSFTQRLGGKSDKTKELRSVTPMGFAKAFYEANIDYRPEPSWINESL